jgi:hypothetical protein
MARSRTRSKGAGPRPAARLALRGFLWLAVAGMVLTALCIGGQSVWGAVLARPEFQVRPAALTLNGRPEWVNGPAMTLELRQCLGSLPPRVPLFAGHLALAVQRELLASPWVLAVTSVERRLPDWLSVAAAFRKPAGVVFVGGRRYMVDQDGQWLPDELMYRPYEWTGERTPDIIDRALGEAVPVGRRWNGPRFAVGARLTDFLRGSGLFRKLDLTVIDVTGVGRAAIEPDITLTAAGGAVIKWGRSSLYDGVEGLSPDYDGPSDGEKLEMLLAKLNEYPGLTGIQYVDLRFHGMTFFLGTE